MSSSISMRGLIRVASSTRPLSRFMSFKASDLTIERTQNPKPKKPKETLAFGKSFSDHMLEVDWTAEKGWGSPYIRPFQDLKISPAASGLHYGFQCFEGMKAYIDSEGKCRLFRPDMNMKRMNSSLERIQMPTFPEEEFQKCIEELVRLDKSWIPEGNGYSLYLRPTAISTHPYLGVAPAGASKLFVILSPVGPYYPTGFKPVQLLADARYVRAWPGGTGNTKIGGNYAMGIKIQSDAMAAGFSQILWLFGEKLQVTEVGTMNQFFFWTRKDGKKELITAALDGTILPGVTRDSILQIAREWGEFEVTEREFYLPEILEAIEEGRMIEAFGAGTAAIVSPVNGLHFDGKDYKIPLDASNPDADAGQLTMRFCDRIMDIQYGRVEHPWSVPLE